MLALALYRFLSTSFDLFHVALELHLATLRLFGSVWNVVLPRLIDLFADSKLGAPAQKAPLGCFQVHVRKTKWHNQSLRNPKETWNGKAFGKPRVEVSNLSNIYLCTSPLYSTFSMNNHCGCRIVHRWSKQAAKAIVSHIQPKGHGIASEAGTLAMMVDVCWWWAIRGHMFPCRFQMHNDGWISHDIIGVYIMMMFYLYDKVVADFFCCNIHI